MPKTVKVGLLKIKNMNVKFAIIAMVLGGSILSGSCRKKGCTDANALNRDYSADINDGSCQFSTATFYASAGYFNGIAIQSIAVNVGGNLIGTIPGTYYPNGPGNCSAQGTVAYKFQDGKTVDWNTTVQLVNGAILYGSGQATASSYSSCIKINVTQ
jgi:hypothetical protein